MSAAQQAQKQLVNHSKWTLQKSTRNHSEMTNVLMVPQTVTRTITEPVTGPSFKIPDLSKGRELIPSMPLQPVAPPNKSLLEDIGLKNDPIHDLNTPFDDAFVEIEYRQPEPNDFVPPVN